MIFCTFPVSSNSKSSSVTYVAILANKCFNFVVYHANQRTVVFLCTRTAIISTCKKFNYCCVVVCSNCTPFYFCIPIPTGAVTTFRTLKWHDATSVLLHLTIVTRWTITANCLLFLACVCSMWTNFHGFCSSRTVKTYLTRVVTKRVTIESSWAIYS
jgi:hypothetical protein